MECVACNGDHIIKNGILPSGGQRFRCNDCDKQFTIGGKRGTYSADRKDQIAQLHLHKGITVRDLIQQYHLSSATIVNRSKKHKEQCAGCCTS